MKVKKFKVPFYKWTMVSIVAESFDDKDAVLKKMKSLKMRKEDIDEVGENFDKKATSGALCCYNIGELMTVAICYPHTTVRELASTLIHEGRHSTDKIVNTVGLEGMEAPAYLNEFITITLIEDYLKDAFDKS